MSTITFKMRPMKILTSEARRFSRGTLISFSLNFIVLVKTSVHDVKVEECPQTQAWIKLMSFNA